MIKDLFFEKPEKEYVVHIIRKKREQQRERSSCKERKGNALALGADEGSDKLR